VPAGGGFLGTLCCLGGGVIARGAGSSGSTAGSRFSRSRSATYVASWRSNAGHQLGSVPPPPRCGASGRGRRGPSPPSPRCGPRSATSPPCVQIWRVAMRTTMLATITAPPRNIVQPGAPIASTPAVTSHAQANAKVAIAGRAACDTRGLATAATSDSKSTTSATTPKRAIEEVIATGLSPRRARQPWLVQGQQPSSKCPHHSSGSPFHGRAGAVAGLPSGAECPDAAWGHTSLRCARWPPSNRHRRAALIWTRAWPTVLTTRMPPRRKPSRTPRQPDNQLALSAARAEP
jgi:hypothetical protein